MINKLKSIEAVNYFYIGWIMMVFHFCVANSNANTYSTSLVSYLALAFFLVKIFLKTKYNSLEMCKMFIVLLCGFLGYYFSKDMRTFWFSIVLISSKNINFNKTVKYTFVTVLLSCFLFLVLYSLHILPETLVSSSRGMRRGFGLGHPNMCSAYYTMLTVLYIYLNYHKITYKFLIIDFVFGILLYYFTESTTGMITLISILFIILIINKTNDKPKALSIIFIIIVLGIVCFTVIPIIYNDFFSIFDRLLTGRFSQANYYFKKYGIHLFGDNMIEDLTYEYTTHILDIGYTKMLINNGVIYYLCVVCNYIYLLKDTIQFKKYSTFILISFFLIYMYTENVSTYIFMNVSMLLFSKFIFNDEKNFRRVSTWKKKVKRIVKFQK